MAKLPRRQFGDFTRAYAEQCAGIREPRPDPDVPGNIIWDDGMVSIESHRKAPGNLPRKFGDLTRAYNEQCAREGKQPECPF